MPIESVVLLGAGGHAKVVYEAILEAGLATSVRVMDDDPGRDGASFFELRVEVPIGPLKALATDVHVAIGDNRARRDLCERVAAVGKRWVTVLHPRAAVSRHAALGAGAFVAALAVVAPGASVGECAIINHAAVVDHDCVVGPWVHVAPNATLGGGVRIGTGALIGAGAVILPGLTVGDWAIVGAGAVLTCAVANGTTVMGVPARPKNHA